MLTTHACMSRCCSILLIACLCLAPDPAPAREPQSEPAGGLASYAAEYAVYRNGKRIGTASERLERTGNQKYRYTRDSRGSKGLARLLGARESESAEFRFDGSRFQPLSYRSETRIAGRTKLWWAEFDPASGAARGEAEGEAYERILTPWTLDPASTKFALARALAESDFEVELRMLDEGTEETKRYRAEPEAGFGSALGCTDAIRVEQVRPPGSSRYTTVWYAPEAEHVILRLDHGKRGGASNSVKLEKLQINGRDIRFAPSCPS